MYDVKLTLPGRVTTMRTIDMYVGGGVRVQIGIEYLDLRGHSMCDVDKTLELLLSQLKT